MERTESNLTRKKQLVSFRKRNKLKISNPLQKFEIIKGFDWVYSLW